MCSRRKTRRTRNQKKQTRKKRKSCKRSCCRWICRKIKRCIKKKLFGTPDVELGDFEVAGVNLGSVKEKLMGNQSKNSLTGALNNAKKLKKKYSLTKSKGNLLDNLVDDYNNGKLSTSQMAKIQLDPKKIDKTQLNQMLNDYEASKKKKKSIVTLFRNKNMVSKLTVKDIDMIDGLDAMDIQRDYNITGSKAKLLENMVTDYKKGKLSLPGLSHKSKFDDKRLSKTRIIKMLENYETAKKKNLIKEVVKNPQALKKKYSITGSKQKILDQMTDDYNQGKISKTQLAKTAALDPKKLTKGQVHQILNDYARVKKEKEKLPFAKSKLILDNAIKKMSTFF